MMSNLPALALTGLLLYTLPHVAGQATIQDAAADRARGLLEQMTWQEKVGQMGGIRRLLGPDLAFNQTLFDEIHPTQNGNIGKQDSHKDVCQTLADISNQATAMVSTGPATFYSLQTRHDRDKSTAAAFIYSYTFHYDYGFNQRHLRFWWNNLPKQSWNGGVFQHSAI